MLALEKDGFNGTELCDIRIGPAYNIRPHRCDAPHSATCLNRVASNVNGRTSLSGWTTRVSAPYMIRSMFHRLIRVIDRYVHCPPSSALPSTLSLALV
jgi:hypothetical protein